MVCNLHANCSCPHCVPQKYYRHMPDCECGICKGQKYTLEFTENPRLVALENMAQEYKGHYERLVTFTIRKDEMNRERFNKLQKQIDDLRNQINELKEKK